VAVAGVPSEAARPASASRGGGGSDSREDITSQQPMQALNVTYNNPRNFAERLMYVLESGIASGAIFWVGDGKAVGLHTKKLKRGMVLETYFRINQFSSFLRNFNRW
jgi:hypothetical protein